jgi:hypothetical protein
MSLPKPQFQLLRVLRFDDGSQQAQLVPVIIDPWDATMNRRGFLGVAAAVAAVLATAESTGCAPQDGDPNRTPASGTSGGIFGGSSVGGVHSSQPCGAPIPPGAVCTCNCVPAP